MANYILALKFINLICNLVSIFFPDFLSISERGSEALADYRRPCGKREFSKSHQPCHVSASTDHGSAKQQQKKLEWEIQNSYKNLEKKIIEQINSVSFKLLLFYILGE
jgi:hypothetical protein